MKKILLTFLVLCLILPLKVLAVSDVDFDITKYTIDANIQDNGDVNVCEYIKLYGSYNGYIRDIYYKDGDSNYNADNISNINVYLLNPSDMSKGSIFNKVDSANKGDKLKYTITDSYNGPSITMFNENISGESGFVLCYTLNNLVFNYLLV